MNIIGIDPGPEQSGCIVYDLKEHRLVDQCTVGYEGIRLTMLAHEDSHVAIEGVQCYGEPVGATVLQTCYMVGRFVALAEMWVEGKIGVFAPAKVKAHLTGNSHAKHGQIVQAMKDRYGELGTKKHPGPTYILRGQGPHVWHALAVAAYAADNIHQDWKTLNIWPV